MTTSKKSFFAVTLQPTTSRNYQANLTWLIKQIQKYSDAKLIVAPEVVLTDFDYARMQEAASFCKGALYKLCEVVNDQVLVLTLIDKKGDTFVNKAVVIHQGKVVHEQLKAKLFRLGNEHRYFSAGESEAIRTVHVAGVNIGILICFELRFIALWQQLKGADIIIVPARWGAERKEHLVVLSKALALTNQCYVIVSDSADKRYARASALIAADATDVRDDRKGAIVAKIDLGHNRLVRRYLRLE